MFYIIIECLKLNASLIIT